MPSGSDPTNMHRATSSGATPGRIDTTRWLLLGGIVGPALLVVGVLAAGLTWPGFDHRARNISDLGGIEAPHPLLLNGTLVVVGAVVTAFSVGLRRAMPSAPALRSALVATFGISLAVQGVTPCTPGCAAVTTTDLLHAATALAGIVAIGIAAILTASRRSETFDPHRRRSLVCGVAVLGLLGAWVTAGGIDPDRFAAGVYQRLLLATALTWLAATATVAARSARAARTHR